MNQKIKDSIDKLPNLPGVYLMKNSYGKIIYVGKAKILKNRVRQYFQNSNTQDLKVKAMVESIDSFEFIVTDNEIEALILENSLIKENQPHYNILLRDDKTHPYIKITMNEDFPRIIKTRKILKDKALYFGPYTNVGAVNDLIDTVKELYNLRTCNRDIVRSIKRKERPCLNFHIKKCSGPCVAAISKEKYYEDCKEIIDFLAGRSKSILENLNNKMKIYSNEQRFEEAAITRDRIFGIEKLLEKQKIVYTTSKDQDYIAIFLDRGFVSIQMFFIRGGRIVGLENIFIKNDSFISKSEILSAYIKQYYLSGVQIPKEIVIENYIEDIVNIEKMLTMIKGANIKIIVPKKGENKKLLNLVSSNAESMFNQKIDKNELQAEDSNNKLLGLKEFLNLNSLPKRIESLDISNISGTDSVGAVIVYVDGKKMPNEYRKYKIKTVKGPNDYDSIKEVIERRFNKELFDIELPDLILVDGGKGQVSSVKYVLEMLELNLPVYGMFKDENHKTEGLCDEFNFWKLNKRTNLYKFVAEIQEEVHRFTIEYHRKRRNNSMLSTVMSDIKGIGKVRQRILLDEFKTVANIKKASLIELESVKGINKNTALAVYNYFRK
ncbi:MAG: excinuclease ABC subunit UvrC [Filifactoraceae bacterium]